MRSFPLLVLLLLRVGFLAFALLPLGACAVAARTQLAGAPAASSALSATGPAVDVIHHDVELSLRLAPPSLAGKGEVRVRARRPTSVITLDARALQIAQVATASGSLAFRQSGDRLDIDLREPLAAGAELGLMLAWQVSTTGKMPRFSADQVWAGYRASAWMPTIQDPAQRATLALRITAPAELKVAAVGRATESAPTSGGLTAHTFVLDHPSPPFLYAFAAGHFDEAELAVDDVTLRALGPSGSDLKGALAVTAPMVRFLRSRTGVPFPSSTYVQVFVHGDDVAQEGAGLSLLSEDALADIQKDPTDDWIFSHELSHQWFGWLVPSADFSDFWLNEGFATFSVAAVKEQRWGHRAYQSEIDIWHQRSSKVHADGRDAPISLSAPGAMAKTPPSESELQPRGVTYFRGALVLDRLRRELGEAVFWQGIRRYVGDRAGKGARTEDLRAALEAASGRDLRDFFNRWIYASAPDL